MNRLARLKRMTQVRTHCIRDIIEDSFINRIRQPNDTASAACINKSCNETTGTCLPTQGKEVVGKTTTP